ncbi:MAG: CoA-binding protein [Deltaproteobacteria bacterium]|nr:CoA-binding protein [Deltaproteobacteria bacterium]
MERSAVGLKENFDALFNPRSIAFFGASKDPRKWGFVTLSHIMIGGFEGKVYPINPKEDKIFGLDVYKYVAEIPETPDLAVIVVPPESVVKTVEECVAKGIKAGIVITAGFAEIGEEGRKIQEEMVRVARRGGMILVGPNCNGITNPWHKLYAHFAPIFPPAGSIALVAQSGNIIASVMRQITIRGYGCSKFVSAGNQADLGINDYLRYLADDPETQVILIYLEGLNDNGNFFEIASHVSRQKPIVMLKAGSTPAGAQAAMSHTASIAGSNAVFDAVCRQAGVIRVKNLDDLLNVGIAFLRQPLPRGRRVGIVTGGGGWGVLAADACAEIGLDVAALPEETIRELDAFMPLWWNRGNPVDLVAGTRGDDVIKAVEVLLRCPSVDAAMMMSIMPALKVQRLAPDAGEAEKRRWENEMTPAVVSVMESFNQLAEKYQKPVIVASEHLFASADVETRILHALGKNNSICYPMPHDAAAVLNALVKYSEFLNR